MDSQNKKMTDKSTRNSVNRTVKVIAICFAIAVIVVISVLIICLDNNQKNNEDEATTDVLSVIEDDKSESYNETLYTSLSVTENGSDKSQSVQDTNGIMSSSSSSSSYDKSFNVKKITSPIKDEIAHGKLSCDNFCSYSGKFVEDGSDEPVENVAAVLITNQSDDFLDTATLTVKINGKTAMFVVTGLPAHRSAWVLETDRMVTGNSASMELVDCSVSFRDSVIVSNDKIDITADGYMLTAVNNTKSTLKNAAVYYRTLHTDGNFLGGITYMVSFGDIEAGKSAEVLAGHYDSENSEIVRISFQE